MLELSDVVLCGRVGLYQWIYCWCQQDFLVGGEQDCVGEIVGVIVCDFCYQVGGCWCYYNQVVVVCEVDVVGVEFVFGVEQVSIDVFM